MNDRPMTMNNRQPVGSRDCERGNSATQFTDALAGVIVRKVQSRLPVPKYIRGPILSGAVFAPNQNVKPTRG